MIYDLFGNHKCPWRVCPGISARRFWRAPTRRAGRCGDGCGAGPDLGPGRGGGGLPREPLFYWPKRFFRLDGLVSAVHHLHVIAGSRDPETCRGGFSRTFSGRRRYGKQQACSVIL